MASPVEHTGLLADSYVWVALSFLLFCVVAFMFGRKSVTQGLDGRIERIRTELEVAARAHADAQTLLAEYQQKARDADQQAARIIAQAEEDAKALRAKALADLEADIARKEAWLSGRLTRMEEEAQNSLQAHAARIVMQSAEQIVADAMSEKQHAELVAQTIADLPSRVKNAA